MWLCLIALFQCLTRPVRNSPNWHSHCAFYVMKRQPCFPAAWGYAGKQQVHTRNRWGNGEMITFVEYLLTSPACCDCSSSWLSSSALSSLHACSGPVWRRQNVRNSSSQQSSYHQNSLMSELAMSNADKKHKHLSCEDENPCTELQRCWYQVYFWTSTILNYQG